MESTYDPSESPVVHAVSLNPIVFFHPRLTVNTRDVDYQSFFLFIVYSIYFFLFLMCLLSQIAHIPTSCLSLFCFFSLCIHALWCRYSVPVRTHMDHLWVFLPQSNIVFFFNFFFFSYLFHFLFFFCVECLLLY